MIGRGGGIEVGMGCIGGSIAAMGDFGVGKGRGIDVSEGGGVVGSGVVGGAEGREVTGGAGCPLGTGVGGIGIGFDVGVDAWIAGSIVGCPGSVWGLEGLEDSRVGGTTAATVLGVGGGCDCTVSGVGDGAETSSKCVAGGGVGFGAESVVTGGLSPSRSSFRSSRV